MIDGRIKQVMSDVLGVERGDVGDDASAETIPAWDSIHHMTLLLALEEELGVTFADADLPDLVSFSAIRAAATRLGAAA
jgi:acyl carrier protein